MKISKILPKPRESFFWTLGYLMGPTIDKLVDKWLKKAGEYLVALSIRQAMKKATSGQHVDAFTSQDHSKES